MERSSSTLFFFFLPLWCSSLYGCFFSALMEPMPARTTPWGTPVYDNLQQPKVNYQKWAAGKNFSLGVFLFNPIGIVRAAVFNTDKNHSVVQTCNATTYKRCNYNGAGADDTIEWSAGKPEVTNEAVSVTVPLVKEGMNYFCGNYDGERCKHGQRF